MRVDDFDFSLPEDRIALEPPKERDGARLLHVRESEIADRCVKELPGLLRSGDVLVVNDTKVIPAQLFGTRPPRAPSAEPVSIDATLHKQISEYRWRAFIRPAKRLRSGDKIEFAPYSAIVESRDGPEATLVFDTRGAPMLRALQEIGRAPLPPYIARRRPADVNDRERYQTIYADRPGSVAAPTAGLHLSREILSQLETAGVNRASVTLHVGAGTFLPVTVDDTQDHKMHTEWGEIPAQEAEKINAARKAGGRIVAVGTTSLRLLESAADENGVVASFNGDTDIFITPGYNFKVVDCLLTNFHLPRSTLFMLVCAFAGTKQMKRAYAHAIENNYRFYSYGDACFLERRQ